MSFLALGKRKGRVSLEAELGVWRANLHADIIIGEFDLFAIFVGIASLNFE